MVKKSEAELMHPTTYYSEDFHRIQSAYYNQSLVLFVGAGASIDAGIPCWRDAVRQFMDGLAETGQFNQDDNLLIPQLYYNERGSGDYIRKAREIFGFQKALKPTPLDETIAAIAPNHIITTNYDHLMEEALQGRRHYYQCISTDGEIPYRYSSHEIIKMHGDFEHNNFVLKEDDYLSYSENFRLIETYVKALIARNTLLFVGYSLQDPDVKQIISWVKNVTGPHYQRAYFLEAFQKYDHCTLDYYRNLGVNILFYDRMYDKNDYAGKSHGELACLMLHDLVLGEAKSGIDNLYYDFRYLDSLHRLLKKQLLTSLHQNGLDISNDNRLCLFHGSDKIAAGQELLRQLKAAIEAPEDFHDSKQALVLRVLLKAGVTEVDTNLTRVIGPAKEENISSIPNSYLNVDEFSKYFAEIHSTIINLNDKQLEIIRQDIALSLDISSDKKEYLIGYIDYRLQKYFSAYHRFQSASDVFFKNHEYQWYIISESNCRLCGLLAQHPLIGKESVSVEVAGQIKQHISDLSPEEILHNIPLEMLKEEGNTDIFRQLAFFTYNDDFRLELDRKSREVVKEANSRYMIAPEYPAVNVMRQNAMDMTDFLGSSGMTVGKKCP